MPDKRAYFKVDVGYLTNPKVASVSVESPTAILLHLGSIAYAAQHLTDGVVPVKLLLRLTGGSDADAKLLIDVGLWHEGPDGHAIVHDYLEHQRSAAEVKQAQTQGKRAAVARWSADRNAGSIADGMPDALPAGVGDASEVAMHREIGEREIDRAASRPPRRSPEHPIPDDWRPTTAHQKYADEHRLDLDREAFKFRNHAHANDRRQRNWNAAFTTWLANAEDFAPKRNGTPRDEPLPSYWTNDVTGLGTRRD